MNILRQLASLGQSIWYDNISRAVIDSGELRRMVDGGLLGVTSNPTIFEKAIAGSKDYDDRLRSIVRSTPSATVKELIQRLMVDDIRDAADVLLPVYRSTGGRDGFVSIEVDPTKARDTEGTVEEAAGLWRSVGRPNVMIKIPATREGLPAITRSIAAGIHVNVTLIFAVDRYRAVAEAYMAGLEERLRAGGDCAGIASVASVFVSRIDSMVDAMLERRAAGASPAQAAALRALAGRAAVANTRLVYQEFKRLFASDRFAALRARGAAVQRPLWGSTGTKNPAYSDLLYVEPLIGPDTVNTVPPATLTAIMSHCDPAVRIEEDLAGIPDLFRALAGAGIAVEEILATLERDGVAAFERSFEGLSAHLAAKRESLS